MLQMVTEWFIYSQYKCVAEKFSYCLIMARCDETVMGVAYGWLRADLSDFKLLIVLCGLSL